MNVFIQAFRVRNDVIIYRSAPDTRHYIFMIVITQWGVRVSMHLSKMDRFFL